MDAVPVIEAHATWMRASGLSDRNTDDRVRLLRYLERALPLGLLYTCHDELVAYLAGLRTPQTKVTYGRHIRGFYSWAARAGHLAFDPAADLPQPKVPRGRPRPVSTEALTWILTEAAEPYRTWALLAAYAGLRAAEIAGLDRADVTEQRITVRHGKGGKVRRVPTHPAIWDAVKDLPDGPLFLRRDGKRYSPKNVSTYYVLYLRRHGIKTSLHPGRHWCATEMLRGTGNVRKVQVILGHASMATTQIYTEVLDEELDDAVAVLPDLATSTG